MPIPYAAHFSYFYPMKKNIQAALAELSKEKEIRILYACESGSRAWGFASPDSDYDVRFMYVKPLNKYLSLSFGEDTINRMLDHDLDFAGWELRKLLNLLRKSNASPFEWLQSPFLYHEEGSFLEELRALSKQYFSPRACAHHYYGIAHNSLKSGLVGEQFKLKTYFYVLRPMLCAYWICERQSIPPLVFEELFPLLEKQPEVEAAIEALLEQKKQASEAFLFQRDPIVDAFITETMTYIQEKTRDLPVVKGKIEPLDAFFRKWVGV